MTDAPRFRCSIFTRLLIAAFSVLLLLFFHPARAAHAQETPAPGSF